MPRATIKNTGVRVITAVICKKAAMIPMIRLTTTAIPVQSRLQSQFINAINISPPNFNVCENNSAGEKNNKMLLTSKKELWYSFKALP